MAIQTLVNSLAPLTSTSREDARPGDVITLNYVGGPAVSVSWAIAFRPEGPPPARAASAAVLSSTTGTGPLTFTVDHVGPYLIRQEVNDGTTTTSSFVRVRALTDFARLRLVAAGEKRDDTGTIPVDASATGWADDQNANVQALAGFLSTVSTSGRLLYVDANRGRNNASTPNNPDVAAGYGDYSTITAAIAAAVSDAAVNGGQAPDADNPFIIAVRPGLYEEDLTLVPFVHVVGMPTTGGALGDSDFSVRVRAANTSGSFFVASTPLVTDHVHVTNLMFESRSASPIATFAKTGAGACYLSNCRIINTGSVVGQGAAVLHQQGVLELDRVTVQQQASADASHLALELRPSVGAATFVARDSRFEGPSVADLDPGLFGSSEALFERCRFSQLGGGPASTSVETWASRAAFTDCVFTKSDLTLPFGVRANATGAAVPGNVHVELRGGRVGETTAPLGVSANGAAVVGTAIVFEGYSEFEPLTLINGATSQSLTRSASLRYDNSVSGITATNMQDALDYMTVVAGTAFSGVADLDGAYDGFNYATVPATRLSGAGRVLTADQGAVEIVGSATSTLAPPLTTTVAGEGTLAVTQQVLLGAVGNPEIALTPNSGHGPSMDLGSLVWPENALQGIAQIRSGQDTTGGLLRNYDLSLRALSAQGSTALGSSPAMGDAILGGGTSFASGGLSSPDAGSVFLLGGSVDASTAGLAATAGDIYLAPGVTNAPAAPQSEGAVILPNMAVATPATLTGMANFTDAGVPAAGTLTLGTSRGMVQVAFAGGEVWAGVGGVQELLQADTGFNASWAGGLNPIVLTTTEVGPKAEVFFVEDSTGGTLNTFFGNFATTAGAVFVSGSYPQAARLSSVGDRVLNLESVLGMTPIAESSILLGQSGFFISDGTGAAPLADRPYYKDATGNLFDLTLGGGVSLAAESYVVLAASGSLTSERVLAGTPGQITIADGGAGSNVTISLNSTGVAAGSYSNPTVTVDAQGRVTAAAAGTASVAQVVATIAARDALTPSSGDIAYVTDASGDGTVTSGSATYVHNGAAWLKVAEAETIADLAAVRTTLGTAEGATDMGLFAGSTLTASSDLRTVLQDLETAVEAAALTGSGASVVATIAARNALTPSAGDLAYVTDASADGTVASGAATYIYDGGSWLKVAEAESESEATALRSLSGTVVGATDMGSFAGSTLTASSDVRTLFQELETAVEAAATTGGSTGSVVGTVAIRNGLTASAGDFAYVTDASGDATVTSGAASYIYDGASWIKVAEAETEAEANDLRTLSGTAVGAVNLGVFGGVITNNTDLRTALGDLETAVQAVSGGTVVANIAARDALTPSSGDIAYVTDASGDATVTVGAATYIHNGAAWLKVSEFETISEADALRALSGAAVGASVLPAFSGSTITTGGTVVGAFQELETALEGLSVASNLVVANIATRDALTPSSGDIVYVTDASGDGTVTSGAATYVYDGAVWQKVAEAETFTDLAAARTTLGTAEGATDMGSFAGSILTASSDLRTLLQELETAIEAGSDDQTAAEVSIADAGALYTGTTVEAALQEVGQDAADIRSLSGTADGATVLPAFGGSTITTGGTIVAALGELEAAIEAGTDDQTAAEVNIADAGTLYTGTTVEAALQEVGQDAADIRSWSGTADGTTVLPGFSGSTITTGGTVVAALQELETAVEAASSSGSAGFIAATIAARDALSPTIGDFALVTDASADGTVGSGSASYIYDGAAWQKVADAETESESDDLRSLSGTAVGATVLPAFGGSTITTGGTIVAALGELETAVEAASSSGSAGFIAATIAARDALSPTIGDFALVTDASADGTVGSGSASYIYDGAAWQKVADAETESESDDLRSLSGTAVGATVLPAFGGTTITTGGTIVAALGELETAIEAGSDDQTAAEVGIVDVFGLYTGTTVEAALQEVGQDASDIRSLSGTADGVTVLPAFGGSTITTGGTIVAALGELEAAVEAGTDDQTAAEVSIADAGALYTGTAVEAALQEVGQDAADIRSLSGTADGATVLPAFGGSTITTGGTIVAALGELETAVETTVTTEHVLASRLFVPVGLASSNIVDDFHVCAWSSAFTPTRLRAYINEVILPAGPGNVTVTAEAFNAAGVSLGVLGAVDADVLVAGTTTTVALTAVAVPSDGVIRVRMEHPGGSPLLTQGGGLIFTVTGTV